MKDIAPLGRSILFVRQIIVADKACQSLQQIGVFHIHAFTQRRRLEIIYATFWGVKSISADEIGNELNDYIEWKYGYRSEATLSMAGTLFGKIPNRINGILEPLYKKWIGYDQSAYPEKRPQPEKAQRWIFAMATIITAAVVLIGVAPMFGYNIDKGMRDEMYK